MWFFKKKKKQKKERILTPEQEKQMKELKKWEDILQNVIAYDGSGKGQIHIER